MAANQTPPSGAWEVGSKSVAQASASVLLPSYHQDAVGVPRSSARQVRDHPPKNGIYSSKGKLHDGLVASQPQGTNKHSNVHLQSLSGKKMSMLPKNIGSV